MDIGDSRAKGAGVRHHPNFNSFFSVLADVGVVEAEKETPCHIPRGVPSGFFSVAVRRAFRIMPIYTIQDARHSAPRSSQ
ncbi:hypothetical protein ColLi_12442 [Colletotrichum liriopes]|uniref:Uncharacterized protein n=1 Tax=Colletotrichum liriopes TaxID=708192 RepID=A0AA37LYR4_9PEZI|nr:hypothetical protein ColLi_12442 [Colletotrichum liriopes]